MSTFRFENPARPRYSKAKVWRSPLGTITGVPVHEFIDRGRTHLDIQLARAHRLGGCTHEKGETITVPAEYLREVELV